MSAKQEPSQDANATQNEATTVSLTITTGEPKLSKGLQTVLVTTSFDLDNYAQGAAISVAGSYRKINRVDKMKRRSFILVFRDGVNAEDCQQVVNDFCRYWQIRLNNRPDATHGGKKNNSGQRLPINDPYRNHAASRSSR